MVRVMDCFFMTCLSASCRGPHVLEGKRLSAVNRFRAHNAMVEERKAGIALPQRKKHGELLGRNWLSRTSAGILMASGHAHQLSVQCPKIAGDIFTCFHGNHDKQPVKISLPVASSIRDS